MKIAVDYDSDLRRLEVIWPSNQRTYLTLEMYEDDEKLLGFSKRFFGRIYDEMVREQRSEDEDRS